MTATTHSEKYQTAANLIRVTGILSIIFGALGALAGIGYTLIYPHIPPDPNVSEVPSALMAVLIAVFWIIPHAFLTVSGIQLVKLPEPAQVKGLAIATIVIGAVWNMILLAFAIVNLAQLKDYQQEYTSPDVSPKA